MKYVSHILAKPEFEDEIISCRNLKIYAFSRLLLCLCKCVCYLIKNIRLKYKIKIDLNPWLRRQKTFILEALVIRAYINKTVLRISLIKAQIGE